MYAFIKSGGKQYKVAEGQTIDVDLLGDQKQVTFDEVLFLSGKDPSQLKGCVVHGEVVEKVKADKVIAFKYKKCKNYRRTVGHRQKYSRVKITKIAHG